MFSAVQESLFYGTITVDSYVDLVIAKSFLHLIQQAAVSQLAEGRQVIIGCRGHKFDLKKIQLKVKKNMHVSYLQLQIDRVLYIQVEYTV